MPISISPMMMRQIIMDHYEHPHNKRTPNDDRYLKINMNSASCIDNIDVFLLVENGIVKDCCFDGVGCTISTASTSIMTDLVVGKTLEEAKNIIENYKKMIAEDEFDENLLDEAIVFINTSKQASRIKCATIGWNGLEELINESEGEKHEQK
ncbi:MAG: SUF system NifU family Fe-S cluster assembly protein [Erysipelotrichaceae bacterium]|nr:SUF system NifU family Fe-S cluster assembly protein [Erysipelotrichaceae bacterium]